MFKIVKLALSIIDALFKAFEKIRDRKELARQVKFERKVKAYDKLEKALQARRSVSDNPDELLSNDGFKRIK